MQRRSFLKQTALSAAALALPGNEMFAVAKADLAPGQMDPSHRTFASYLDVGYDQSHRPQFHFTSRKNWLNDPNGLVYYDGEWHLFFQHYALGLGSGTKTWGHAVSRDMVHWKQIPHAILPYSNGAIWSGTAVIDHHNSLGRQIGDTKTMVAYFTKTHQPGFFQAAAYSTDKGRTFTLINKGEALVANQGYSRGERDPKVFWNKQNKKWVMVLILGGGRPSTIRFFESDNMVDWEIAGEIKRRWAAECIDMFELSVDGDKNNSKWVLADASYDYEVGNFDGKVFSSDEKNYQGDLGSRCFYASQVFNNAPNGRVVQIGWMKDKSQENVFLANNMPFNQQLSFPCELSLRTTAEGIRLFRWPVNEIANLYAKSHKFKNLNIASANKALAKIKPELIDLSIEFEPGGTDTVELSVRGLKIRYDNASRQFTYTATTIPAPAIDGKVKLRLLVDRTSLELFANDGAAVSTDYAIPAPQNHDLSISADGVLKINLLVVNELESAWPNLVESPIH
ncbi:MAG: glycoside hydrolase family 32 protein [Planctomycetes bacterium]|nr:glycoside hydrolase family 32 protein [Planctomycetota bacterium]